MKYSFFKELFFLLIYMLKLGIVSYKFQVLDISYWWMTPDQKPLLVNYPGFHLERTNWEKCAIIITYCKMSTKFQHYILF